MGKSILYWGWRIYYIYVELIQRRQITTIVLIALLMIKNHASPEKITVYG